jgi:hypothetical protein
MQSEQNPKKNFFISPSWKNPESREDDQDNAWLKEKKKLFIHSASHQVIEMDIFTLKRCKVNSYQL